MAETLRVDKWLWYARFFKTRTLASKAVQAGIRINQVRVAKAHFAVKPGDVLTFDKGGHVRVIEVRGVGARRGPFSEAQGLYTDLSPPPPRVRGADVTVAQEHAVGRRDAGAGRPTKRDRRKIDALKDL